MQRQPADSNPACGATWAFIPWAPLFVTPVPLHTVFTVAIFRHTYVSLMHVHVDIVDRLASSSSIVDMFLSCVKCMPAASTQCGTVDVNNLDTTDDFCLARISQQFPPPAPLFNIGREWDVFEGSPRNIKEGGYGVSTNRFR